MRIDSVKILYKVKALSKGGILSVFILKSLIDLGSIKARSSIVEGSRGILIT